MQSCHDKGICYPYNVTDEVNCNESFVPNLTEYVSVNITLPTEEVLKVEEVVSVKAVDGTPCLLNNDTKWVDDSQVNLACESGWCIDGWLFDECGVKMEESSLTGHIVFSIFLFFMTVILYFLAKLIVLIFFRKREVPKHLRELYVWFREQLKKGYSKEEVAKVALSVGWKEVDVDEVLKLCA